MTEATSPNPLSVRLNQLMHQLGTLILQEDAIRAEMQRINKILLETAPAAKAEEKSNDGSVTP